MVDLSNSPTTAQTSSSEEPLIKAVGLRKVFPPAKRGGEPFTAVDGIDFELRRGEVFGFLGPNGAGKSSTMRMIGCVSPMTGGELTILGMDPRVDSSKIKARLGVVPQEDSLDMELRVRENLLIYGRYFGLKRAEIAARTAELLEFVQLSDRAESPVEPLSGGMKRRLTIARSLINSPEILLLDEPTTGLDPQARHVVWDRLFRLKQAGTTLILTTHYMDEAEQLCDRLVVMDHGRIAAEGSPRELIERYSTREVLEIRFAPDGEDRAAASAALAALVGTGERGTGERGTGERRVIERIEELPDRILLYSDDGEAALAAVSSTGSVPVASLVRRSSLEDVFLHLTGRTLVD